MKKKCLSLLVLLLIVSVFSLALLSGCSNSSSITGTYYYTYGKNSYVELFNKGRAYVHGVNYINSTGKWYLHKNRILLQVNSSVINMIYNNGSLFLRSKGKIKHLQVVRKIPFMISFKFVKKGMFKSITQNNYNSVVGTYKGYMDLYKKKMEPGFFGSYAEWVPSKKPIIVKITGNKRLILSSKGKSFSPVKYRFKISGDVLKVIGGSNIFGYSSNTLDGSYLILKHKNKIALASVKNTTFALIKQ